MKCKWDRHRELILTTSQVTYVIFARKVVNGGGGGGEVINRLRNLIPQNAKLQLFKGAIWKLERFRERALRAN